jgi:hypothetical protein
MLVAKNRNRSLGIALSALIFMNAVTCGGSNHTTGKNGTDGAATGSGGTGGTLKGGSGGGSTATLLDAISTVCKADCDKQFALECAPKNTNTLTCQLSCAASTSQLGDFCLVEYHDYIACRGNGGYDCLQGSPYPRATCAIQQLAFSSCTQHIGCKRYCQKMLDLGCNVTPIDTCVATCTGEDTSLPSRCSYSTETIAYCQATTSTECAGSTLNMPTSCSSTVLGVAECFSDDSNDLCAGWCWAANRLGCGGTNCASDCAAKKADSTCGSKWNDLLDCAIFFGDAACDGGSLVGNGICSSDMSSYQKCTTGSGP